MKFISRIVDYFNLNKPFKFREDRVRAAADDDKKWKLYTALVSGVFFGIFFSETIINFTQGNNIIFDLSWPWIIISLIITFIIIPAIYKSIIDDTSPLFIKFCIFVQNGIFWRLLFSTISAGFA